MPIGFEPEPPIQPEDTTSSQPIDLNDEPPISPDDTNPSKSQLMRAVNLADDEPPIAPDDTSPSKSQLMMAVNLADQEPTVMPDDTNPSIAIRSELRPPAWQQMVSAVSLLLAVLLTLGAIVVLMLPPRAADPVPPTESETQEVVAAEPSATATPSPTEVAPTEDVAPVASNNEADLLPTISAEQASAILQQPLQIEDNTAGIQIVRNPYDPFTLIPDRPRGEVIQYTVEAGDTIASVAEKFGLEQESIAWANSRDIVGILPVGRAINIVPTDGVLVPQHTGSTTIREYAARYRIDDPFTIIESEYNPQLRDLTPDSIPPSGAQVFIPGGQAEEINWNPTVVREGPDGGGSGAGGNFITFAPGDPGSCGRVANPGGGGFWSPPISNYSWVRGFTSFHTGVDLSAPIGTPVQAAQGGTVIFSGWNNWGYGYTVVLAHGPFTSIYGHLSGTFASCGQSVAAGTTIGASGNSGNSSGPHLHFEIRFNDQPQDPTQYLGF